MQLAQQLIDRARGGQVVRGTVVSSPDPALAEMLAAGFDFVWIDLEHSALCVRDVQTLAIAARAAGCVALARMPSSESELLTAVLDAGVDGVVSPRVSSAEQAQRFVAALTYPPSGSRGFAPRRGNRFGLDPVAQAGERSIASVVQIETCEGLENVEQIASVPGVDWLVVGLADLSFELGVPLRSQAPELLLAVERVRDAAAAAGVCFGLAASGDEQALLEALQRPLQMLLYSSDARIYAGAVAASHRITVSAIEGASARWSPQPAV